MTRPTHEEQADALERDLSDEDRRLLDRLADALAGRRLVTPAMFLLESVRPLSFVAGQAMVFFRPLLAAVLRSPETWDRVAALLARRGAVELLLRRLEARA
ncbi:MAG TPA: hypothetical protein VKE22_30365 [Haliangiales bacterium]|nr:hypothetical protein [Haliangiales bacterium]